MEGRIVKGIAGFYYVKAMDGNLYECKARGIFRKDQTKPMVGDYVDIEIVSMEDRTGNVCRLGDRKNELLRPAVSNVDQALVIFAVKSPDPNYNLLDRFLIMTNSREVPVVICLNKADLISDQDRQEIAAIYKDSGCDFLFTSTKTGEGMALLKEKLYAKTTTVAGPSGVGKSSIVNSLLGDSYMETGILSEKIERGKNTTRHAELVSIAEETYIMDTPGFTSLELRGIEREQLRLYYPELAECEGMCRFDGCSHTHEPDCLVKKYVSEGKIHPLRYENYCQLYGELGRIRRY
ncbi:MAG: ribosome small subunit-dependent GTPase A [Lachnospiraceae bacterium]|nr:ribosome small subunit-dependent GTPase A [Candidatus Merdinaster equi]